MKLRNTLIQLIREEVYKFKRDKLNESAKHLINEWNAAEVIRQLGGNRFIAMTGAKNFVKNDDKQSITFKIGGGAKNGINYIRITLTPSDLYDIEFLRLRGNDFKVVAKEDGLYHDQLADIFTQYTGFYTTL